MRSSQSIQLLDSQNNNISPITSVESLYIDASYIGNNDYVRYRVFDRIPFLAQNGSILNTPIEETDFQKIIVDVSAEKSATGPKNDDISVYKLKYKYMSTDNFYGIIENKIDSKLETYLDVNSILDGNATEVEVVDNSNIKINVLVDGTTIIVDSETGALKAPMSPSELGDRITHLESSVNTIEQIIETINTSVDNNTNAINDIIDTISILDTINSSVNSLESSTAYMKKYIDFMFGGVTEYTSLSNVPVEHQSVNVDLTSSANTDQYLSLAGLLDPGQDMNIRVYNSTNESTAKTFTIYLGPNNNESRDSSGATYYFMSPKKECLRAQDVCEINVWCYREKQYSVKYIFREV